MICTCNVPLVVSIHYDIEFQKLNKNKFDLEIEISRKPYAKSICFYFILKCELYLRNDILDQSGKENILGIMKDVIEDRHNITHFGLSKRAILNSSIGYNLS